MSSETVLEKVFRQAANDPLFRRRIIDQPGIALSEEGFVLSDEEMRTVRAHLEPLRNASDREINERVRAIALSYRH